MGEVFVDCVVVECFVLNVVVDVFVAANVSTNVSTNVVEVEDEDEDEFCFVDLSCLYIKVCDYEVVVCG